MNERSRVGWALAVGMVMLGCSDLASGGPADSGTGGSPEDDARCREGCPTGSTCVSGQCEPQGDTTPCAENGLGGDSCGPGSICTPVDGTHRCVAAVACDEDADCELGDRGAMCNESGLAPGKDRICLVGACVSDAHCPPASACAAPPGGVGRCGDGQFGAPCTTSEQCVSGSCFAPVIDQLGVCS